MFEDFFAFRARFTEPGIHFILAKVEKECLGKSTPQSIPPRISSSSLSLPKDQGDWFQQARERGEYCSLPKGRGGRIRDERRKLMPSSSFSFPGGEKSPFPPFPQSDHFGLSPWCAYAREGRRSGGDYGKDLLLPLPLPPSVGKVVFMHGEERESLLLRYCLVI